MAAAAGRPAPAGDLPRDRRRALYRRRSGGADTWALPDLTARKFTTIDGLRYYRTGDRVHLLADGEYAFLGRIDRQFKLRGQLVEPDEIEACLTSRRHPQDRRG